MKATVTTTSQSLREVLWETKYQQILDDQGPGENRLTILVNWISTIYIENWEVATVSDWFPLEQTDFIEIPIYNMERIRLIAEWSDNTDVRFFNS